MDNQTQKQKKPTLTVGIPAYNEQANIASLIKEVLVQEQVNFRLERVIVFSDGSTDDTVSQVKSIGSALIELISNPERKGVAFGLNAICQRASSGVLVIVNADIWLRDRYFLEKISRPVIGGEADLAAGTLRALPPTTFFEKIIFAGVQYKKEVFENYRGGNNLYTCYGPCRAFSKRLYKTIEFKDVMADDMYSYLFCLQRGWKFFFERRAVVYYRLPGNLIDHQKQSIRFYHSCQSPTAEFDKSFISLQSNLLWQLFWQKGWRNLLKHPLYFPLYVLLTTVIKIKSQLLKQQFNIKWQPSASTKNLRDADRNERLTGPFFTIRKLIYNILPMLKWIAAKKENPVRILCYHAVSNDKWRYSINYENLQNQVKYLLNHYHPITLGDLELYFKGKLKISSPSFILTFDDGYQDIMATKSFFQKLGIQPAVFILSNCQSADRIELETEQPFLTNQEILELKAAGWEIGCHSATHPDFSCLNDTQVTKEIIDSKKILETQFGFEIKYFAYPKGKYSNEILTAVRQAGYSLALTMDDRIISRRTDPLALPRIGIDRTHSFKEFKSLFSATAIQIRHFAKQYFFN